MTDDSAICGRCVICGPPCPTCCEKSDKEREADRKAWLASDQYREYRERRKVEKVAKDERRRLKRLRRLERVVKRLD